MKNNIKKIILICFVFLFSILLAPNVNAAEDMFSLRYFMDISKFGATNPNPISSAKTISEEALKYSIHTDPHCQIDASSEKDGKEKVSKAIIGIGILELGTLRAALVTITGAFSYQKLSFTAEEVKTIKESKKNYIIVEGDYADYHEYDFISGIGFSTNSKVSTETKAHYKKTLTVINNKFALITETEKTNLLKETKNASGACFTLNKKGTNNQCSDVISSSCTVKDSTYFLYGISCKNINSLFMSDNTKADIVASDKNSSTTESTATSTTIAAKRDEIEIQFQVPFGGVQHGIDFATYINEIYKYLIGFALVLTGIMFSIGGFQYMLGKKESLSTMRNAALGLILLVSSYTVLQIINPNALDLKQLKVAEIERESFEMDMDTGGPADSRSIGATGKFAGASSATPMWNKFYACNVFLPPTAASSKANDPNKWNLSKCINPSTSKTRITDENKMREMALQYMNNQNNANEHIVYLLASTGTANATMFSTNWKPSISWNKKGRMISASFVKESPDSNTIIAGTYLDKGKTKTGFITVAKTSSNSALCMAEKSFAKVSSSKQKNWANDKEVPSKGACEYQSLITVTGHSSKRPVYRKKDNDPTISTTGLYQRSSKDSSGSKAYNISFALPNYQNACTLDYPAMYNKDDSRLCLSCIGFIQNFYGCIGRPMYFSSATTALLTYGQAIESVEYKGEEVYINGKKLKVGDVIGWPSGGWDSSLKVRKQSAEIAIQALEKTGTVVKAKNSRDTSILKYTNTTRKKEVTIANTGHVIMYIGKGQTLDWGAGYIKTIKRWESQIAYVLFLNDVESSLHNKIKNNDKYKYKDCNDIYTELKSRYDEYFKNKPLNVKAYDANRTTYSLPILHWKEIYNSKGW